MPGGICQAMGCEELVAHLESRHGIVADEWEAGAGLHVETVYCLGNCALSPAALLDGEPIGRLDRGRLDTIVAGQWVRSRERADLCSRDSAALSVGADAVASALALEARRRGVDLSIVRTGSRGLFWLEPLVEVETPDGPRRLRAGNARRISPHCSTPDFRAAALIRKRSAESRTFRISPDSNASSSPAAA